jgi:hypothetical protein
MPIFGGVGEIFRFVNFTHAILSCSKQGPSLVLLCGSAVEASDSAEQVLEFGKNAVSIVLAHSSPKELCDVQRLVAVGKLITRALPLSSPALSQGTNGKCYMNIYSTMNYIIHLSNY